MKLKTIAVGGLWALLASTQGRAQIAELVAGTEIPAGSVFAPHTPAGVVIIGPNLWVGDGAQGLRHYVPVDPANTDPINTGNLMFDINTEWSIGGGTDCIPWCSVGQAAQDGSTRAYVAVYDHQKGQPFQVGGPGVWMVEFQSVFGTLQPVCGIVSSGAHFRSGG